MAGTTRLIKVPLRAEVLDALMGRAKAEDRSLAKTAARLIEQGLGSGPRSDGPAPVTPRGPLAPAKAVAAEPVLEPVE